MGVAYFKQATFTGAIAIIGRYIVKDLLAAGWPCFFFADSLKVGLINLMFGASVCN